jgi:hypothetical protein
LAREDTNYLKSSKTTSDCWANLGELDICQGGILTVGLVQLRTGLEDLQVIQEKKVVKQESRLNLREKKKAGVKLCE